MLVPMILNYLAVYLNLRTTLLNPLGRSSTVSGNQTLYLAYTRSWKSTYQEREA